MDTHLEQNTGRSTGLVPYDFNWPARFEAERARLAPSLGPALISVEHVGATSVPGLPARPEIDLLVSLWAHPLEPACAPLEALGYARDGEGEGWLDLRHASGEFRLRAVYVDLGNERLVLRDFLRSQAGAAREHGERKLALADPVGYEAGKANLLATAIEAACAWRAAETGFSPVLGLAAEMEGFPRPWLVGSGWAVDLELGRPSRLHLDLDLVVARGDQLELQRYLMGRGFALATPGGGRLQPWRGGQFLELPWHQVHAMRGRDFIDVLLSETDGDLWRWRRQLEVSRPLSRVWRRSSLGVPYLAPEVVLLFKSTGSLGVRDKDTADFEALLPRLDAEARAWLRGAIALKSASHPWLERLV